MTRSDQQQLIDIMFEVAIVAAESMHGQPNDDIAAWVAHQLEQCGFKTTPMGSSWGVLSV